ncbi:hypothetical protein [Aestuariivirga litoralis]|uniref:hypothetical protein n=1 Tax=Aestuariivirga litoralis TaxID=2650924 RepID=UPI0018C57C04|nr:hypothetical protein [Aestuariivirga litoralis]MBG1232988.1 hypothetical protein [Aestuariivirga litoralis]
MSEIHPLLLNKHCLVEGCKGMALFGFGQLLRDRMVFACREHRALLDPKPVPAAPMPAYTPPQGKLL